MVVPLSRAVVIMWLATERIVAGHPDQAEAAAAELGDTPAAQDLRRKIAARRDGGAQPERRQAMTSEQIELERVHLGIADLTESRERVLAQITALEEQLAKLEQQIGNARQFGREDLAQAALTRLNVGQGQIAALKSQLDQVLAQREKLTVAAQRLQAKIDGGRRDHRALDGSQ